MASPPLPSLFCQVPAVSGFLDSTLQKTLYQHYKCMRLFLPWEEALPDCALCIDNASLLFFVLSWPTVQTAVGRTRFLLPWTSCVRFTSRLPHLLLASVFLTVNLVIFRGAVMGT